ncbi:MAG TPA: hypothetical protein VGK93_00030 [Candidatus Eisenbacteria bacterium]
MRLRLWAACLAGALVSGAGVWWVMGTQTGPQGLDVPAVLSWLVAVAGLGIVVGAAFALWLDHGLVVHLRGLTEGVTTGQVARLRGLPAASGWGELSQLTQRMQVLLTRHRLAARAVDELGLARHQLDQLRERLGRWNETERWSEMRVEGGLVGPVVDAINRGLRRQDEVREQNLEAARQIGDELAGAVKAASESRRQAEGAFLEATAMLTTVRELERLGAELARSWAAPSAESPADGEAGYRGAARAAIEELVTSSTQSVDQVARALLKAQEIAEQVALLANRATLIALHAASGGSGPRVVLVDQAADMKQLADQVRAATDRTTQLTREIEMEVAGATERMRGVRERVAEKLDRAPLTVPKVAPGDMVRLVERVREMIQDATQKGVRLSAAGERVSRAANDLVRDLEAELQEMSGMVVRLSLPEIPQPAVPERPRGMAPEPRKGLRLLGERPAEESPGSASDLGEERT